MGKRIRRVVVVVIFLGGYSLLSSRMSSQEAMLLTLFNQVSDQRVTISELEAKIDMLATSKQNDSLRVQLRQECLDWKEETSASMENFVNSCIQNMSLEDCLNSEAGILFQKTLSVTIEECVEKKKNEL